MSQANNNANNTHIITKNDEYYRMTSNIIDITKEGEKTRVFLLQNVTEEQKAKKEQEEQIERLNAFADMIVHDLRNPLNVAKGYADTLENSNQSTDELRYLQESIQTMQDIIDDISTYAQETQRETQKENITIEELVYRAELSLDTENVEIAVQNIDNFGIYADNRKVTRLFENLFTNSLKHGFTEGTQDPKITVELTEEKLCIRDNGDGISENVQEHLFEQGITTGDGLGLGLTIVKQVIDDHGWEITSYNHDNGGAVFEITNIETCQRPHPTSLGLATSFVEGGACQ